jgi:hypothetical protein
MTKLEELMESYTTGTNGKLQVRKQWVSILIICSQYRKNITKTGKILFAYFTLLV